LQSETPVDAGSSQANGVKKHEPVKVTISTAVASPQLLQAGWKNQVLPNVMMEMTHMVSGKEQLYMRLTLRNATITGIDLNKDNEVLSFQYEQMTMEEIK
jgi:type VI secretion system Hcp family effector